MGIEGRPLTLLVNPAAGGGRTRELLPQVEAELDKRRIVFRVETTKTIEGAIAGALRAADAGEIPVVMSGDGLLGAIGGALAGTETPMGIVPGGRGNDLARVLGIPTDPAGAIEILARGETRRIDVGEANGRRFLGIASAGFDSDANRIANETRRVKGSLVYAFGSPSSRVSSGCASPATPLPPPTARPTAAGCSWPPTRTWPMGSSTW
jgi:diacylglycerol kinase family enzyme